MANYPQLDNTRGVWNIKEVYDAIMGGYWPNASGGRAIYVGGASPSASDVIDYITMASTGDAADFGDLSGNKNTFPGVCSSFTRGLIGDASSIDHITYASTGNAADFGDMSSARGYCAGLNNSVRGLFGGGKDPNRTNVIDYVTMTSTGNATDFGDLTVSRQEPGSASSPTRGLVCAGMNSGSGPYYTNTIDYIEIATTGDATDFGDATNSGTQMGGCSSSTRGTFMGGQEAPASSPGFFNTIDYVEIASQGNATDYGDLSANKTSGDAASNSVRGIFAGGETPSVLNVIEYFTIAIGGTVTDFGDLATARKNIGAGSNQNGGLNDGYQGTRPAPAGSGLALFAGGYDSAYTDKVEFINLKTLGNAADWGNLITGRAKAAGTSTSSATRGIAGSGSTPSIINTIDSTELQIKSNFVDYGDLSVTRTQLGGHSNSTRAIFGGGYTPSVSDVMDYNTIATFGNSTDFGDLTVARSDTCATGSSVRYVQGGGNNPGINTMDYVTIASTGDAQDFGDLNNGVEEGTASASDTRGLFAGGRSGGSSLLDVIDYITIASTGDATDFGDLTSARRNLCGASNLARAVFYAGEASPGKVNTIDYVTIASTGDAADFGDASVATQDCMHSSSDGHGGLQG